MGRPLNKKWFGNDQGKILVIYGSESDKKKACIVKQLSTKKYRLKDLETGEILEKFLSDVLTDDTCVIETLSDMKTEPTNGKAIQINSRTLVMKDGTKYVPWSTDVFVDKTEVSVLPTISDDSSIDGNDSINKNSAHYVEGLDYPVMYFSKGNPANGFSVFMESYFEVGVSFRYRNSSEVPTQGTPMPFRDESGNPGRFAWSLNTTNGAKLSDFNIEMRFAKDTINPDYESYFGFKLDKYGNWVGLKDTSVIITDSLKTDYLNQNIQSLDFDFIKSNFNQKFEGDLVGKFQIYFSISNKIDNIEYYYGFDVTYT